MILAAGLSFLGLGPEPPEPEWGLMLEHAAHRDLCQSVGCGLARRHDLRGVDLLQSAQRRHAQRHGYRDDHENDAVDMLEPVEDVGGAAQPLLQLNGLTKHFPVRGGLLERAQDGARGR